MRRVIVSGLLAVLLIGCAAAAPLSDRLPTTPTSTVTSEIKPEWEKYFDGQPGTFVLVDLKREHTLRYNPDRAAQRFLPASTFKILNSLISLETGVIPDENTVIKWHGTHYDIPSWNQDHTLKTAIANSVVWYFRNSRAVWAETACNDTSRQRAMVITTSPAPSIPSGSMVRSASRPTNRWNS